MEIEHASHCTYRIRYHMVFVVKYRKQMLLKKVPLGYFKKILEGIGQRYYLKFEAVGVEEDHFHVVLGSAPRYAPSDVMRIIKSITAKKIFESLSSEGQTVDALDVMIASIAMVNNEPILTLNKNHFERIPGVKLI